MNRNVNKKQTSVKTEPRHFYYTPKRSRLLRDDLFDAAAGADEFCADEVVDDNDDDPRERDVDAKALLLLLLLPSLRTMQISKQMATTLSSMTDKYSNRCGSRERLLDD